jgi:hypothetical protein
MTIGRHHPVFYYPIKLPVVDSTRPQFKMDQASINVSSALARFFENARLFFQES